MWVATTAVGAILIFAVLGDALGTTVNVTERSGRIARFIMVTSRRPLRALFSGPSRPAVALGQVVMMIVAWTGLLWLGWWLVLLGEPMTYAHDATGEVADALDTLYVAGFGVFALGVGDIAPASRPAQVLLPLSSVTGLALVTLEVTYLLILTQAVAHKRQVARMIHSLGDDADEIVQNCWTGSSFRPLRGVIDQLSAELSLLAEHQLSFPVLYEFGARRETLAVAPGLVRLLDAVHLMRHLPAPEVRLPALSSHQLVTGLEEVVYSTPFEDHDIVLSEEPRTETLERLEVPLAPDPTEPLPRELRRRLHLLAAEEGWPLVADGGT